MFANPSRRYVSLSEQPDTVIKNYVISFIAAVAAASGFGGSALHADNKSPEPYNAPRLNANVQPYLTQSRLDQRYHQQNYNQLHEAFRSGNNHYGPAIANNYWVRVVQNGENWRQVWNDSVNEGIAYVNRDQIAQTWGAAVAAQYLNSAVRNQNGHKVVSSDPSGLFQRYWAREQGAWNANQWARAYHSRQVTYQQLQAQYQLVYNEIYRWSGGNAAVLNSFQSGWNYATYVATHGQVPQGDPNAPINADDIVYTPVGG